MLRNRAVASGPAGPVLAGPDFAQETHFLNFKAGHFAHISRLGGGGGSNHRATITL